MRVLTIGTFDMLHPGHLDLFQWCRNLAGKDGTVVVAVNRDEFVERYKQKRPILSLTERSSLVESCKTIDEVVIHEADEDCLPTIEKIKPDILVVGSDWLKKDYLKQINVSASYFEDHHIALVYIPRSRDLSTTEIKKRIMG